jgi:hypothetical protein
MTNEEYKQLKRFDTGTHRSFEDYCQSLSLSDNTIFECYTLSNTIRYVGIAAQFEGLFFDIRECSPDGQPVRCPYRRNNTRKEEIAERLYRGDWRLFTIHSNSL